MNDTNNPFIYKHTGIAIEFDQNWKSLQKNKIFESVWQNKYFNRHERLGAANTRANIVLKIRDKSGKNGAKIKLVARILTN